MLLFIKNLLFPKFCLCCNKFGKYICKKCEKTLSYMENEICFYCEKRSENGLTHPACRVDKCVDRYIGIFNYNPTLKKVIASIKYRLITDTFEELFIYLEETNVFSKLHNLKPFFLQPIPLHKNRQKQRGFNQSVIIGKWLAKKTQSPVIDALTRVIETKTQATLSKAERRENAKSAFEVKKPVFFEGKTVMIIDDVVTTGSTVKEAARVIKAAGADKIIVFSIAKG